MNDRAIERCGTIVKPDGRYAVSEIRFVIGVEYSDVYVFVNADANCPDGIHGWHVKRFSSSMPFKDIYDAMCREDSPLMWPAAGPVPAELTVTDLPRLKI